MSTSAKTNYFLILVIALQWCLFIVLLRQHQKQLDENKSNHQHDNLLVDMAKNSNEAQALKRPKRYKGVFATVIFRAPKWMHLRYTLMIHNALANLPTSSNQDDDDDDDGWVIQLFLNRPWVEKEMFPWHPGFKRLLQDHPRVVVTDLPANLTSTSSKPKHIMVSPWFYNSLVADTVLMFSANGAFCGNHADPAALLEEFMALDYCGAPSPHSSSGGGDGGTHSLRNRRSVLQALAYARQQGMELGGDTEYAFITKLFSIMNKKGLGNFTIATEEQTQQFAGVHNLSSTTEERLERLPLLVSGTHARLEWGERDSLLKHCPEVKMIFPSLHEPACFGAHPNGDKCKETICALQDKIPGHGC